MANVNNKRKYKYWDINILKFREKHQKWDNKVIKETFQTNKKKDNNPTRGIKNKRCIVPRNNSEYF